MVVEKKLYTVDEFERFIALPQNHDRLFELIDGEVVEKMPTREHGIVAGTIVTEFNLWLRRNPVGRAAVEARHRAANDLHNDRLPDVSVVIGLEKPIERAGTALYIPDLCVEIKSPTDSLKDLREKARYYLANGARLVWLVLTEKRLVEVYTRDDVQILTIEDTLDGGDVLPGFTLPVREIFPQ